MIRIPADMGPQAELALRRAWDFALGRLMQQDAPMSAVKVFLVVFELRHRLRPRLEGGETIESLAGAAQISADSCSRALAWLRDPAHDFVFHGRKPGGRLGSAIMLRPLYLSNVQEVFHRKHPQVLHKGAHPRSRAGVGHYTEPPRSFGPRRTVGAYSDTAASGRISPSNQNGQRQRSTGKWATGNQLLRGLFADLAPPGCA